MRSVKNTTKCKENTVGSYPIRGAAVKMFLEDSKAESIAAFFQEIRRTNGRYNAVTVLIDNSASHRSKFVKETAKKLGI